MYPQHQQNQSIRPPAKRLFRLAGSFLNDPEQDRPATVASLPTATKKHRGRPAKLVIPEGVNRDDFYRDRYKEKKAQEPKKVKTPTQIATEQEEAKRKLESYVKTLDVPVNSGDLPAVTEFAQAHPALAATVLESNDSRGKYLTDAPTGKGLLSNGFGTEDNERSAKSDLERIAGHAEQNGLAKSFKPNSVPGPADAVFGHSEYPEQWNDLEWIQNKLNELLQDSTLDPGVRTRLQNSSIDELREFLTAPVTYEGNTGGHTGRKANTNAPDVGSAESLNVLYSESYAKEGHDQSVDVRGCGEFDYFAAQRDLLTRELFETSTGVAGSIDSAKWKQHPKGSEKEFGAYRCGICRDMKGGRAKDTRNDTLEAAWEHFLTHSKTINKAIAPYLPKHMEEFKKIDSVCSRMSMTQAYDSTQALQRAAMGPCKVCKPGKKCELHEVWSIKEVS